MTLIQLLLKALLFVYIYDAILIPMNRFFGEQMMPHLLLLSPCRRVFRTQTFLVTSHVGDECQHWHCYKVGPRRRLEFQQLIDAARVI